MSFHDRIVAETVGAQEALFEIPFVRRAVAGEVDRQTYVRFLGQAYHHVKHTVPLLMATGAALPPRYGWLRHEIAKYIDEEIGHEEWILDDVAECGRDPAEVRDADPDVPCDVMVAYAYDVVHRKNPLGFFGMVHVLEGASVRGASDAARRLEVALGLPPSAFTYLTTHGELDQDHVGFFRGLMDRIDDERDQRDILRSAHVFFRLYGDVFRGLMDGSE